MGEITPKNECCGCFFMVPGSPFVGHDFLNSRLFTEKTDPCLVLYENLVKINNSKVDDSAFCWSFP